MDTALPKEGGRVMIVSGSHRGECGQLVERSSSNNKAVVRTDEHILTCGLDQVAEYS